MTELRSQEELAGAPPLPPVELKLGGPPLEIIELYPNPLPPPGPPPTRESTLADLQVGFASLSDDELRVARLWLTGESFDDVCCILQLREKDARKLWQSMRGKVRFALLDEAERAADAVATTSVLNSDTGTPPGTGGPSPA